MASELKFGLVISAIDKASSVLKGVVGAFGAVTKAGDAMGKAAAGLRVARENIDDFSGRVRGGLRSILAPSQEVEAALMRLAVIVPPALGDVNAVLDRTRASALAWQSAHVQSAAAYVDTSHAMVVAGLSEASAISATETALRVATGTSSEASGVAETLAIAYAQMGDHTRDAGAEMARLGDVLTRVKQVFPQVDVAALSDPMKDAVPAAKLARVNFEQLTTVLGALNAAGIKGGESGAAVADMMKNLTPAINGLGFQVAKTADGNVNLIGTLQGLEHRFGPIAQMAPDMRAKLEAAFGPAAFKALTMLSGQTDKLSASLGRVQSSAGAAAQAQAMLEGTTGAQMRIAQQQIDAVKVEIAQGLTPAILELAPVITGAVKALGEFATAHPEITAVVGSIAAMTVVAAAVISPILSAGGAIASLGATLFGTGAILPEFIAGLMGTAAAEGTAAAGAGAFAAALLANPLTWIIAAIIALAAVVYIYWEPISGFFVDLWAKIKEAFIGAWDALVGAWNGLIAWFTGLFGGIRDAFKESFIKGVWKVFTTLSPIAILAKLWLAIIPWMAGLWVKIGAAVWDGLQALAGLQAKLYAWVWNALKSAFGRVVGYLTGVWNDIKAAFDRGILQGLAALFMRFSPVAWIMRAWNAVVEYLFGISLVDAGARILDTFIAGVRAVGSTIKAGISSDLDRVFSFLSGFSLAQAGANIVGTIVDGMRSMANAPVEAMTDIVTKVRRLLPFSPAKDGPLRDLHKIKLVETVAASVKPAPLVDAMTGVAGAAMGAIANTPVPRFAPIPESAARGGGGGGSLMSAAAAASVSVQIYVGAGTSSSVIDELEAWIRDPKNVGRLAAAVQRSQAREARKGLT